MSNLFVNALDKGKGLGVTEKGAVSNLSTGSKHLDYFFNYANFRNRTYAEVSADMDRLWKEDNIVLLKMIYYLRMITRKVSHPEGITENVMKGQGNKSEGLLSYLWLLDKHTDVFYTNAWVIPAIGSWKDYWDLLFLAEQNKVKVDWDRYLEAVFYTFKEFSGDEGRDDLYLKYLPLRKSNNKCKTPKAIFRNKLAKKIERMVSATPVEIRKLKSSGNAHKFQQLISTKKFNKINFDHIPGKALNILATGKFLINTNQSDRYDKWIASKPVAKFNGYPYELAVKVYNGISKSAKMTIDKQFNQLLETAKKDGGGFKGNVWACIDTSGSMTWTPISDKVYPIHVCVSMGIYFAMLNEGFFKNRFVGFSSRSTLYSLPGDSFVDNISYVSRNTWMGSTNFQSVIDLLVETRKRDPGIPVEDFPSTIIVISDMQFDPGGSYGWNGPEPSKEAMKTNYEALMSKLRAVGLPDISIVWWYVRPGKINDVPSTTDDPGTYYFSGFDGSVLTLLLGGEEYIDPITQEKRKPTALEAMSAAINQEILQYVSM